MSLLCISALFMLIVPVASEVYEGYQFQRDDQFLRDRVALMTRESDKTSMHSSQHSNIRSSVVDVANDNISESSKPRKRIAFADEAPSPKPNV